VDMLGTYPVPSQTSLAISKIFIVPNLLCLDDSQHGCYVRYESRSGDSPPSFGLGT